MAANVSGSNPLGHPILALHSKGDFMRQKNDFVIIPCDCGTLDHSVIYVATKFSDGDINLLIKFPLYHASESFLQRFKNVMRRRFNFTFNITMDGDFFYLFQYLWKISFPDRIFEFSVMENEGHWKLCFSESEIVLKYRPTLSQLVDYFRYGVIERSLEIFIAKDGPIPNDWVKIIERH